MLGDITLVRPDVYIKQFGLTHFFNTCKDVMYEVSMVSIGNHYVHITGPGHMMYLLGCCLPQ